MGASRRRWLYRSTLAKVAYSTATTERYGPRRWMTSNLNGPLIVFAKALS